MPPFSGVWGTVIRLYFRRRPSCGVFYVFYMFVYMFLPFASFGFFFEKLFSKDVDVGRATGSPSAFA